MDYLHGNNTMRDFMQPYDAFIYNGYMQLSYDNNPEMEREWIFGINIYDELRKCMMLISENEIGADRRPFFIINEHKKIMVNRLLFLYQTGFIKNYQVTNLYNEIEIQTELMLNLMLKYLVHNDKRILEKIDGLLEITKKQEKEALLQIIDEIKSTSANNPLGWEDAMSFNTQTGRWEIKSIFDAPGSVFKSSK